MIDTFLISTGKRNNIYSFNSTSGKIKRVKRDKFNAIGSVHRKKYFLWIDIVKRDWVFQVGYNLFYFSDPNVKMYYSEGKYCCCFEIRVNNKVDFKKKYLKSFWELCNISTYDFVEKTEDNYLLDIYDRYIDFNESSLEKKEREINSALEYYSSNPSSLSSQT